MSDFDLSALVFVFGFVITVVTVGMIYKGHSRWKGRDPFDSEL